MTPLFTLQALADALIGKPDRCKASVSTRNGTQVIYAAVGPHDYGRLIGQGGSIVESLRIIVAMAGRKEGKPWALTIPHIPDAMRATADKMPFVPNLEWRTDWLRALAQQTATATFTKPSKAETTDTDDGKTRLQFVIEGTEPRPLPDTAVESALASVFRAIGNANGRKVNVTLRRK
jgi:predicted RNA-binding protein YlqC (UPF0109 family)